MQGTVCLTNSELRLSPLPIPLALRTLEKRFEQCLASAINDEYSNQLQHNDYEASIMNWLLYCVSGFGIKISGDSLNTVIAPPGSLVQFVYQGTLQRAKVVTELQLETFRFDLRHLVRPGCE